MTKEELSYGLSAMSAAPISDTTQARAKAIWIQRLADELDREVQNEQVVGVEEIDLG